MTKVIDLMELYRILNSSDDPELLLKDMMEEASLDERIDRDILADTLVAECGTMYPRWNTTTVFKRFGINFFRRASREIRRDLDALELEYDPLMEYEESKSEIVDEDINDDNTRTDNLQSARTDNLTELRTDNLNELRTDNLSELRTDDLSQLRTDNLSQLRTPNLSESTTAGAGAQIDRYVSADNESDLVIRSRDVSTIPGESTTTTGTETTANTGTQTTANTGTQTTANTGTQTTANTGTQTTANTGTQTTANTGTQENERHYGRDLSRDTEITGRKRTGADLIREEIAANHFNIYDIIVRKFADQMLLGVY